MLGIGRLKSKVRIRHCLVKNGRSAKFFRRCCNQCFVIQPPWLASAERDENGYVWDFRSNTIDPFKVIDVRTDDARAAMLNQIRKIVGG